MLELYLTLFYNEDEERSSFPRTELEIFLVNWNI